MKLRNQIMLMVFCTFLLSPAQLDAQLGLLGKLGKIGSKAGKVAKAGKMGRPARVVAKGAGLYFADDLLRMSANGLEDVVVFISREGEELILRTNLKGSALLDEGTTMLMHEGVEESVKRGLRTRQTNGLADDLISEAFEQSMDFVLDAELLDEETAANYGLDELSHVRVRCSDGWIRPLVRIGDRKLVAFQEDLRVYVPLEQEGLLSQIRPMNAIIIYPDSSFFKDVNKKLLPVVANLFSDVTDGVYADIFLSGFAGKEGFWIIGKNENEEKLWATLFWDINLPADGFQLPGNWKMPANPPQTSASIPDNTPHFAWIIAALVLLVGGYWGLMKLFVKAGKSRIEAVIPVYNHYQLFQMTGIPGKEIWKLLIPGYNIYVYYHYTQDLCRSFNLKQHWVYIVGTILPPALWAWIGFSNKIHYYGPD